MWAWDYKCGNVKQAKLSLFDHVSARQPIILINPTPKCYKSNTSLAYFATISAHLRRLTSSLEHLDIEWRLNIHHRNRLIASRTSKKHQRTSA